MSKDLSTLKADAQRIKNETGKGANTATRVGSLFEDIVDKLGDSLEIADGSVTKQKLSQDLQDKIDQIDTVTPDTPVTPDTIIVDSELNGNSTNPVQNKVVTKALYDHIADTYTKEETDAIKDGLRSDINQYSRFLNNKINENESNDNQRQLEIQSLTTRANSLEAASRSLSSQVTEQVQQETSSRAAADTAINLEITRLNNKFVDYYTREQVGSVISNTPETDVVVADALASLDDSTSDYYVAPTDRANKLFRIPGAGNTSYSEYAWDGTQFVLLDEKDYGVDQTPTENSPNVMESGGLYDYLKQFMAEMTDNGFKFAIADKNDNLLAGLDANDILRLFVDISLRNVEMSSLSLDDIERVSTINGIKATFVDDASGFVVALLDPYDNLIVGVSDLGEIVNGLVDYTKAEDLPVVKKSAVYERNVDKEPFMLADCNYDYNPSYYTRNFPDYNNDQSANYLRHKAYVDWMTKRLQLLITTDTHLETISFDNAVKAATDFVSVDAIVHLGDFTYWLDPSNDSYEANKPVIDSTIKPLYMTPGNHDVGERSTYVKYCKDDIQIYNRFIKPSIDRGFLKEGEYQIGRCYYYHDFDEYKVRLIMLYPYDDGNVFDDTYWEAIAYNPSYPNIERFVTYAANDCINVPGYDSFSFKAKSSVYVSVIETSLGSWDPAYAFVPKFKAFRFGTWYQQAQIDWLINLLEDAGEKGYTCIVGQHQTLLGYNYADADFDSKFHNPRRRSDTEYEFRFDSNCKNIISQIVDAYQRKDSIDKTVRPMVSDTISYKGTDNVTSLSPVVVHHTFANSGKVFFIHGHNHTDTVERSNRYDQLSLGFAPGTLFDCAGIDLYRRHEDGRSMDTMTALSVHEDHVSLTRIGCDVTGEIDPDTHTLIRRINEAIDY